MTRREISSGRPWEKRFNYSRAVRVGSFFQTSLTSPADESGRIVHQGDVYGQARQCLSNLAAVCAAAGASLDDAVRLTVYLTDMGAFGEVNEVYGSFFAADPPARVAIGVASLPRGGQVEIDAVVAVGG